MVDIGGFVGVKLPSDFGKWCRGNQGERWTEASVENDSGPLRGVKRRRETYAPPWSCRRPGRMSAQVERS